MSGKHEWWNDHTTTKYFAGKPADPRIVAFLQDLGDTNGKRALDLGCGGGRHSELLAKAGFTTSSIDVNPEMLATTKARLEDQGLTPDVQEGSITHIPFADNTFDVVTTTGVQHQARSLEEYDQATTELARVVKSGGYVLLNVFTSGAWDDTYEVVSEDGKTVRTKEGLLMTLLSKEEFVQLMEKHDLALIDEQGEDIKQENTGPRAVYRAFFRKK